MIRFSIKVAHHINNINVIFLLSILNISCGISDDFEKPDTICLDSNSANTTYAQIRELLHEDRIVQIHEEWIVQGYIISSDREGNFFNTLHFQEEVLDESGGMQLEMDLRDSYLFFPAGTKVFIKLHGLYISKSNETFKIGDINSNFGNETIGRLPAPVVTQHIMLSCKNTEIPASNLIELDSLHDGLINTLIELNDVEFTLEEPDSTYAEVEVESERILRDCRGNEIILQNSGYSNFQSDLLPEGRGSVSGVLLKDGKDYIVKIRSTQDIDFQEERCFSPNQLTTTDQIIISEISDPDNNSGARFVELYNSSSESVSLYGWQLRRYTNASEEVSSTVDLTGHNIDSKGTLIISANSSEFEMVYGFKPDIDAGANSAADSNGDDNLELVDPFETVIDRFGVPGEDGSGTDHEFEDGGAFRKEFVHRANPVFDAEQWDIFNDSGGGLTVNKPLIAPDDFNPDIH